MFTRLPNAAARAMLVVLLVVLPSLMLPGSSPETLQIVTLTAIFAALFTLVEYMATSPSLVEFRDAPPFNRLRFVALFATVLCLSAIFRDFIVPSAITSLFVMTGNTIGAALDFPFSPVRLVVLMMPAGTSVGVLDAVRMAAGISYFVSLLSIIMFVVMLRLRRWPRRTGAFNVWVNLPTFDPTAGGDVVKRLQRDSQINVILGFLLPFLIPGAVKIATAIGMIVSLEDSQTLIWTITAWAFLPASLLMRGVALSRVAQMIEVQRQQARAAADGA